MPIKNTAVHAQEILPEIQNTRVTPRKCLSRIPQLMVRKHTGNPKHQGDAILERLLATRHAFGQGPSSKDPANPPEDISRADERGTLNVNNAYLHN